MDNVLLAFGLTVFAGLSTGIGSAIAFLQRLQAKSSYLYHLVFQLEL